MAKLEALFWSCHLVGEVPVPPRGGLPEAVKKSHYLPVVADICKKIQDLTYEAVTQGTLPLCLGGDHSVAMGSMAGVARYFKERTPGNPSGPAPLGVIWIDAHADINTPASSSSGNIHGMPVSVILGQGFQELVHLGFPGAKVAAKHFVLIGLRDLDPKEKQICKDMGVHTYTMEDIDKKGMERVMEEALRWAGQDTEGIHLSVDMDSFDPMWMPAVSVPAPGGLTYREARLAMEMLSYSKKLVSMDFVELNPLQDTTGKSPNLAVELILSAFGKTIL
jgi:arginase